MNASSTSTAISTTSAIMLAAGGLALLFGADEVLRFVAADTTAQTAMLGQMIAAGWLAIAWLNWSQRHSVVGGIYGRPMVLANLALYLITAFSLVRPAMAAHAGVALPVAAALSGVMAVLYGMLMVRGPFGANPA